MNVQKISNLSFESRNMVTPKNLKAAVGAAGVGIAALMANRASLQKDSNISHLNMPYSYDDYSERYDSYETNQRALDRLFAADDRRYRAEDVISASQFTNGLGGLLLSQITSADITILTTSYIAMATKISTIYGVKLSKAVVDSLGEGFKSQIANVLVSKTVGKIPILGNIVNMGTNMALTKTLGEKLIDKFENAERRYKEMLEKEKENKDLKKRVSEIERRNAEMNRLILEQIEKENRANK